jgi:hypothetical protein
MSIVHTTILGLSFHPFRVQNQFIRQKHFLLKIGAGRDNTKRNSVVEVKSAQISGSLHQHTSPFCRGSSLNSC